MKKLLLPIFLFSFAHPAWAQSVNGYFCHIPQDHPNIANIFDFGTCLLSGAIFPILFALAILFFMWGVTQYVANAAEEAKREKGKQFMIWGLISLVVIFSIWGLVNILKSTFVGNGSIVAPKIQTP